MQVSRVLLRENHLHDSVYFILFIYLAINILFRFPSVSQCDLFVYIVMDLQLYRFLSVSQVCCPGKIIYMPVFIVCPIYISLQIEARFGPYLY